MGSGFSKKKKQARLLQEQLGKIQNEMQNAEYSGQAGNGLVQITIGGDQKVKQLKVHPDCVDREDVEGLESLLKAAIDEALAKMNQSGSAGEAGGLPDLGSLARSLGL